MSSALHWSYSIACFLNNETVGCKTIDYFVEGEFMLISSVLE